MNETPIVLVEKVQLRRGLEIELPGKPAQLSPLRLNPGLSEGEIAMTIDSGRLFLGHNPRPNDLNYQRSVFPYQNVEVLTENSPRVRELFNDFSRDQENFDFFLPTKAPQNSGQEPFAHDELEPTDLHPTHFYVDSATITIEYAAFVDSAGGIKDGWPVKHGIVRFLVNEDATSYPTDQGTPNEDTVEDSVLIGSGLTFDIQKNNDYYFLTYHNQTGNDLSVNIRRVVVSGLTSTNDEPQ